MSFQSVTTTPLKPSSFFKTSVIKYLLACTGVPLISPELIIILFAPALIAAS